MEKIKTEKTISRFYILEENIDYFHFKTKYGITNKFNYNVSEYENYGYVICEVFYKESTLGELDKYVYWIPKKTFNEFFYIAEEE